MALSFLPCERRALLAWGLLLPVSGSSGASALLSALLGLPICAALPSAGVGSGGHGQLSLKPLICSGRRSKKVRGSAGLAAAEVAGILARKTSLNAV